jgi:hypothetical protein
MPLLAEAVADDVGDVTVVVHHEDVHAALPMRSSGVVLLNRRHWKEGTVCRDDAAHNHRPRSLDVRRARSGILPWCLTSRRC